jgi:hypothetical protein
MARLAVKTNLVLDEELDTLDGSGGSLGDGGGDTTHCCPVLATGSLFPSSYQRAQMRERHQRVASRIGTAALRDRVKRTQEVNDEAGHAHELLLALATMVVSSLVSSDGSQPPRGWRMAARDLLDILGRGSNSGRHLVGGLRGVYG